MHSSDESSSAQITRPEAQTIVRPEAGLHPRRLWAWSIGLTLIGGLTAWSLCEWTLNYFIPPTHKVKAMGGSFDAVSPQAQALSDRKNATLAFTILGSTVGLALGLAGGLSRKSKFSTLTAGLAGLILGGLVGASSSHALLEIYYRQQVTSNEEFSGDLILPVLIHGGICACIGAACGIAFGTGAGARNKKLVEVILGSLFGGALGAVAYEVVGALAFPNDHTNCPIAATWPPRLLAAIFFALFTGAFASIALLAKSRGPRGAELVGL